MAVDPRSKKLEHVATTLLKAYDDLMKWKQYKEDQKLKSNVTTSKNKGIAKKSADKSM
jgi:hypothetical protein